MPTPPALTLISHPLCPYVQRAVIALREKDVPFRRRDIDLADKPDWFLRLSPLGKTPVLQAGDRAVFESAVIVEYLEDTVLPALHPADTFERADHRAHIELASQVLNQIAGLYGAPDRLAFTKRRDAIDGHFDWLEQRLAARSESALWFDGRGFSLVDAAFGPVFRYFDVIDEIVDLALFRDRPRLVAWRGALAARESVRDAVVADYPARLRAFLARRGSHLSGLMSVGAA